ncbi:Phytase domain protein [Azotobacter vinelandii CA]|uniref:Phytase domain protein n=2 Tax=Azotobacter vinelandii TaxID=354 RepID=C1DJG6_AZOVD|nr:phytase [Azotobacter vinelandii]ACO76751.1 Phytase domain protein [Azotobacter vinelandii DJ]AGK15589.1 Phytase domain protein [Azotobacter vinelandii CA]AGK19341.1 Phytase domain protein [Azotobacter vinelandii CA6]SFX81372.1 3-phytase [Azotobacter vinelandii]GLK60008.1 3-phytase [Azotobacter vinelandii]
MIPAFSRVLPAGLLLCAGLAQAADPPRLELQPWKAPAGVEIADLRLVPDGAAGAGLRLAASERQGLLLLDGEGRELARQGGSYASLDSRLAGSRLMVAALDETAQRVALFALDPASRQWGQPLWLPARDYGLAGLCLYRDQAANLHLFLLSEEGRGEQWLVGSGERLAGEPRLERSLPLPAGAGHCQVEDGAGLLFVNEEDVGLWAYPAHPEADGTRRPVDMLDPFGSLGGRAGAVAALPGGLLALDPRRAELHLYQWQAWGWQALGALPLAGLAAPERLAARPTANGLELLVRDDDGRLFAGTLDWRASPPALPKALPEVAALRQSEPVGRHGDAADDPAIWVHPGDPARSRVLGTDKKQGLQVYDLDGKLLQELPVGRLNNVDLRPDFALGGTRVDLAVASHRDRNSIVAFAIDRASGELREAGEISTPLAEIYGICLFQPAPGELYAFANGKDGSFRQYRLYDAGGRVAGEPLRGFRVASQPEGCVADDRRQRLFLGEEDTGVWALDARPDAPVELQSVIRVGADLQADVEGLALYRGAAHDYLVVSSQGNDSYLVLDAEPPHALKGAFRVGLNVELGIDGASETDGLEIVSADLGGPWSTGLLVVQDGRKRMPERTQNFKFVPWSAVAERLGLAPPAAGENDVEPQSPADADGPTGVAP